MQMHKHANRFYSQDGCRAALATGSKLRFDDLARELNVLVDMLEEKLSENDLPLKHQHWTMFSGLQAYLCLWQCCEVLKDTQRLQQVRCKPSAPAANDMLHLRISVTAAVNVVQNADSNHQGLFVLLCMRWVLTSVADMQLANTISAIFMSTQTCSAPHVNTMVRISKCAARLCPGEPPM